MKLKVTIFLPKSGILLLKQKKFKSNQPNRVVCNDNILILLIYCYACDECFPSCLYFLDAEVGVTNEENQKLVTEDYLGLTDGEDVDVIDYSLVPFLDTSIKIKEAADKIYFVPNGSYGI